MKAKKRIFCIVLACLIAIFSGACNATSNDQDASFRIVTSFYPMYIMALNLTDGVDGVELANMAKPSTGCLHDYQLRPKDVVCLDGADIFLTNGAGMEDFLADVLEAYPDLKVYEAVDALSEEDFIEEEGHHHDHDHDEAEETETDSDHDHDHDGGINPHTWLDPALYRKELAYFKDVLVENDPAHEAQYVENYLAYDARIEELQQMYDWNSIDISNQVNSALILHESFPYILRTCHIDLAGAADVEKDSGFSAKEIRQLVDVAKDSEAGYILSDNQYSGRISELLAEETGMEVWKLDSCVSGEYDNNAYIDSMKMNYQIIFDGERRQNR